jgi:adenosylcobinamide-GDP ribazoletransferase
VSQLHSLAIALGFLTLLPLGREGIGEEEVARAVRFFPAVGLVLGLVIAGAAEIVRPHLPPAVVAVGLVALLAMLTGGLHLDGVADLFDALGAGAADRQHLLAIMRDSRIGAHGAAALTVLLLAKASALTQVLEHRDVAALIVFPAVARWAVVPLIIIFPPARPDGLGAAFKRHTRPTDLVLASVFAGLIVIAGRRFLLAEIAALSGSAALGALAQSRLGGVTGDACGAVIEIAEVISLVALVTVPP